VKYLETLIARIETGHWLLLSQQPEGNWTFEIWGTYPLAGSFGATSDEAAQELLFCIAKPHLEQHGVSVDLTDVADLSWRVAVRQDRSEKETRLSQPLLTLQPS
jgi:hypothetical protein